MVCDCLHIICGNCGAYLSKKDVYGKNEVASAEIEHTENEPTEIYIHCENCGTVHSLNQYMDIIENN